MNRIDRFTTLSLWFLIIAIGAGCGKEDKPISDADSYYERGVAYTDKGQHDKAISDYSKVIEIDPGHANAYINRGVAYQNKGHYDLSISDFTRVIEIDPSNAVAYNNRGLIYLAKLGNKEKGCSDWKQACELGICNNYNKAKREGYCK